MVQTSQTQPPGMVLKPCKYWDFQLPTSTGDPRISSTHPEESIRWIAKMPQVRSVHCRTYSSPPWRRLSPLRVERQKHMKHGGLPFLFRKWRKNIRVFFSPKLTKETNLSDKKQLQLKHRSNLRRPCFSFLMLGFKPMVCGGIRTSGCPKPAGDRKMINHEGLGILCTLQGDESMGPTWGKPENHRPQKCRRLYGICVRSQEGFILLDF